MRACARRRSAEMFSIGGLVMKSVVAAMAVFAVVGLVKPAVGNPAGTWRSLTRINNQPIESTLKLRVDSEGPTLAGFYIDGQTGEPTQITPSQFNKDDDRIAFQVIHEFNGQKFAIVYRGTQNGDRITGTSQFERSGRVHSAEWTATRQR
jgi:hypothetical protein